MGFQASKLSVCHVMREPGCGKARKWNHWTASPFWSSRQSNHSHGNPHGPSEPPSTKAFSKRRAQEKKDEELKWRTLVVCFSRPYSTLHALRTLLRCFLCRMSTNIRHSPSPPTSPVASERDACVSCHLSSSLIIPKKGCRFLPLRPRPAGLRRKTFWGSSHTPPLFRIAAGMPLRAAAAWDCAAHNRKYIFDAAVVFVSCPQTTGYKPCGFGGAQSSGPSLSSSLFYFRIYKRKMDVDS